MAYQLKSVTIRIDNSDNGMKLIDELYEDILSGKLPILVDSDMNPCEGIIPISKYSNYESDEAGYYDLSVMGVSSDFFQELDAGVANGKYKLYEASTNSDITECIKSLWKTVWSDGLSGKIRRAFTTDYESAIPAEYSKDGKSHCYLYIAVQ